MPPISFFVQTYNTAPFLAECIEGILRQQGNYEFEIILIDDASTDGTEQVARSFKDPRLRYIRHEKNQGAIATANEGYALCRGRFIARNDSDDRYHPNFLVKTVPVLEEDPRLGLVYGDISMIDAQGRGIGERVVNRKNVPLRGNEFLPLLLNNYIPAPTTIMRREALQPLLPIPGDLRFFDWYLTTGITEQWDSCYVNEVLADYRIHTTNMHRSMIRDRTGEATSLKVLDRLFANGLRQEEKRRWRRHVYTATYLEYADKYFGTRMNEDARRCYRQAVALEPSCLLHPG